jgi:hypothetical protein
MYELRTDVHFLQGFWDSSVSINVVVVWVDRSLSKIFQLYRGGQYYWWRKQEYPEKTTDLRKSMTNFITYCIKYTSQL